MCFRSVSVWILNELFGSFVGVSKGTAWGGVSIGSGHGIEEGLAHAAVLKGGMGNMQWHK